MNFTVSARIIGGYVIVLLLAAAILFAGLFGLNSINNSLHSVTDKAVPMVDSVAAMLSNQLEAQVELVHYHKTTRLNDLEEIAEIYSDLSDNNTDASTTLKALAKDNPDMAKKLEGILAAQSEMFDAAEQMMTSHEATLKKAQLVNNQTDDFIDMGDEVISYAVDIEGLLKRSENKTLLSKLTIMLDDTSTEVLDALENTIPAAVVGAERTTQENFAEMDSILATIEQSGELTGADEFVNLQDSYAKFKQASIGSSGVLNSFIAELRSSKEASAYLKTMEEASRVAVAGLNSLATDIRRLTKNISVSATESVSFSQTIIIIFAVIAIVVSGLIAFLVTQSIRKPLHEIVEAIQWAASGDLQHDIVAKGNDELSTVASSVQELVVHLRSTLQEINGNSSQLAATAEETAAISEQSAESIARQKDQTNMIATAIEEMTATVDEVARSINLTLEEVEKAHTEVSEGSQLLDQNIAAIRHLSDDIDNGATVIENLNENAESIGSVVDVIRGVAEQTNLLALNAAIEAARAGEQGRGFAVVADEVRTLASRAQSSTDEIHNMIEQLQAGAREAVTTMNKSREEAQTSVDSIIKAGEMLGLISTAITNIKDMSHQIASAAEEQAAATQEQNRNINEIAQVAEETATGASENQMASHELARMAETQLALVRQFKV